jgi:dolichyl-phosphate-mannose-protein mannosyltransferase
MLAVGVALVSCSFVVGLAFIPYPGIQNDEAVFSWGVYDPGHAISQLSVFKHRIPMMLISYLGALKSWVYTPILAIWEPSGWSVRLPVLAMGAVTIWLFCRLVYRIVGARAALAGCALLAFDTTYLLTTVYDWGPVALQHLLMVGGVLSLVRFHQGASERSLAVAFLLFGLALWDKALFVWTLAAIVVAGVLLFWKTVVLALVAFSIGAFPLLRYNVQKRGETWRRNVAWSRDDLASKTQVLRSSLDGSGLFGYIAVDEPTANSREPRTPIERASVTLSEFAGHPRNGPLPYLLAAALLLVPLLWHTPARGPALFAVITSALVWAQMAFTKGAGTSVHHTALMWPWPHLLIGVTFAEASRRLKRPGSILLAGVLVFACGWSLLVSNEYLSQLIRNGGSRSWTDASQPLCETLERTPAKLVYIVDWGIFDTQRLLSEARLPLRWGVTPLVKEKLEDTDWREFREMISDPEHIVVGHTPAYEEFPNVRERLRAMSEQAGYRRELLHIIRDSLGREVFEVFRFRPAGGPPAPRSVSSLPLPG